MIALDLTDVIPSFDGIIVWIVASAIALNALVKGYVRWSRERRKTLLDTATADKIQKEADNTAPPITKDTHND